MERIASGYQLAEAPVAAPDGGVIFSDVLGGGVHQWSPTTAAVDTVIPKRRGVGGMAAHADGGLVVSGRDVCHISADGSSRTVFSDDTIAGLNDLTVDPDGHIVVGILRFRPFAGESPVPGEFVRVEQDGSSSPVFGGVNWVNGCAFSPDGSIFYGCDYDRGLVLAADRHDDGSYGPPRTAIVSPSGQADGLAVDEAGGVWVALGSKATVGRFRPDDGTLDQEIAVPTEFVASLCFGGRDLRSLFVTTAATSADDPTGGGVFLTTVGVPGAPITPATMPRK